MVHEEITECVTEALASFNLVHFFPNLINIQNDTDETKNAQGNMYIAEAVDSEVADEGHGLYEDEEQDNYLEDEEKINNESLGEEFFDM